MNWIGYVGTWSTWARCQAQIPSNEQGSNKHLFFFPPSLLLFAFVLLVLCNLFSALQEETPHSLITYYLLTTKLSLAMFATSLSLGLALLPFVSAAVHDIQVGAGGKLVYSPEAIVCPLYKIPSIVLFIGSQSAQPGDQVVFHFNPKNHTVTQSSFADPCGPKSGGISSGLYVTLYPGMENQ